MHRVMIFKIGSKRLHVLKLIGAFVFFGAALMFLTSVYQTFLVSDLLEQANRGVAQTVTANIGGFAVEQTIGPRDLNTQLGLLLPSLANLLFWSAIVILGGVIYQSGSVIVPVEEEATALPELLHKKRKLKKRK
ncbi:MAG: hypothetical protein J4432_00850 [DPANN group archaeon]|nr:hypothetical protein [DPANN group archaeon]